jgi:hypothetical protein
MLLQENNMTHEEVLDHLRALPKEDQDTLLRRLRWERKGTKSA